MAGTRTKLIAVAALVATGAAAAFVLTQGQAGTDATNHTDFILIAHG